MFSRLLRHFLLILPELGRCHRTVRKQGLSLQQRKFDQQKKKTQIHQEQKGEHNRLGLRQSFFFTFFFSKLFVFLPSLIFTRV